jgi:Lon protease-like protein
MTEEHFIFPLGTVLFPGGALPLKIFEQRYIEMTKICIRDNRPFGVCLIREGSEIGEPAVPEPVGCLASIERWDMPQLGLFELLARGGERFRLVDSRVAANGLMSGEIERIPPDTPATHVDSACREVLKLIINRVGAAHFPEPIALDDATWVGCRLAEVLPLDGHIKQSLLEVRDAGERLDQIREILLREGLVVKDE